MAIGKRPHWEKEILKRLSVATSDIILTSPTHLYALKFFGWHKISFSPKEYVVPCV